MTLKIGVDTGGTHTDLVLVDTSRNRYETLKVPTTPDDLGIGILDGVTRLLAETGETAADVETFLYGTTFVTNLIVEQDDVEVGLITTEGFRDVVEIGRASRKPNIYDINWRPNPPLVPRRNRYTVPERINARGEIVTPLDEAATLNALHAIRDSGIKTVAVCLFHSYANTAHERAVKQLAAKHCPELKITLSCDIVREFREFERSSTTCINAYVLGPMDRHLTDLADRLAAADVSGIPYIMRGNGGIMSFDRAKTFPVSITHSGPVAGIIGAAALGKAAGLSDIITFDMGGTSSDISVISDGRPVVTTKGTLADYPILLPVVDLVTIGAGGGSIARLDSGGALKVGPKSAGSVPGPLCYGQGGTRATITDANILTGRLNPDYFLAGAREIFPDLARSGVMDTIAAPLKLDIHEAALGILDIAESHMVNAIKLVSVERGLDPRDFTLMGFGGAGPLHVVNLAEALGIKRVLVPPAPGNTSATGLLCAEIRQDLVRTFVCALRDAPPVELERAMEDLMAQSRTVLQQEGVAPEEQNVMLSVDLRYEGQSHELAIPFVSDDLGDDRFTGLIERFETHHRSLYGYDLPERRVDLVNIRATAFGLSPALPWPRRPSGGPVNVQPGSTRRVLHRLNANDEDWPVYRFVGVRPGVRIDGPAIVEYPGSTLVIPPNWTADYDTLLNTIVTQSAEKNPASKP